MSTPQNQTPQPETSEQMMMRMLQQMQALQQTAQPQPQSAGGWGVTKPAVPPAASVLIPISIESGGQNCGVYLQYGPEYAAPEALLALIGALIQNGVPVKTWAPKSSGWGKK